MEEWKREERKREEWKMEEWKREEGKRGEGKREEGKMEEWKREERRKGRKEEKMIDCFPISFVLKPQTKKVGTRPLVPTSHFGINLNSQILILNSQILILPPSFEQ
jgi:hypothetical protein